MPTPLDTTRMAKALLSEDERPLVDRMTMLPIGQYEDGSLTLAWPQMLVDMYEGGVRSFEQGRQLPRVDSEGYYAGTPRAEPLDAFNAASAAPMAGVAVRVSGAVPKGALGSGGSDLMRVAEKPGALRVPGTHYTTSSFDTFDPSSFGGGGDAFGKGVYSTPMEWVVRREAEQPGRGFSYGSRFDDGARNIPTEHVLEKPFAMDKYSEPGGRSDWGALRSNWFGPKWKYDMSPWEAAEAGHFGGFRGDAADAFNASLRAHGFDGVTVHNGDAMEEVMSLKPDSVFSRLTGEKLFANDANASAPSIALNAMEKPQGIRAYHGSPHDFDKFDLSKIGAGEGNQSYGRGLYFAENDSIARYYRDAVTDQHSYRSYKATDPMAAAMQELRLAENAVKRFGSGDSKDYALQQLDLRIADLKRPRGLLRRQDPHSLSIAENLQQSRDLIANGEAVIPEGHFYEVNINAEPDQFLDWSTLAPSEQARLKTKSGVDDARARGIPGVKYLDASSRNSGAGTHNYVVFDDSLIDIMRKYANPETAAAPSLLLNSEDGQQNPLLASVDPVYDTRMLLQFMEEQRMKERKRIAPPMDPGAMQDQYSVDYPDDPQEPEPYRRLPRRPR